MVDMSNKTEWENLLEVIQDAKGSDIVVLDMTAHCSWGDRMLIVTAGSQMHMRGIYGRIVDYVKNQDELAIYNHPRTKDENRWILVDLGSIVVHVMTKEAREYYNLEDIWFESPVLYREDPTGEDESYSSSSS